MVAKLQMPDINTWKSSWGPYATAANAITASRIIFFGIFIYFLSKHNIEVALIAFVVAWGLDAIDGFVARRMGEESVFGSQLDKLIDRIIIIGAVVCLIRYEYLPAIALFLLVKDIGLSVALTVRKPKTPFPSAGIQGKALSLFQGVAILWLIFGLPFPQIIVGVIGLWGAFVAIYYLKRL